MTQASLKHSFIILIPKGKKDLLDLETYRSISLINQDAQIFTKILVNKMNTFINKYVKEDQCGFIVGRQMANLTRRVLNIIQVIEKQKMKVGIISVDIFEAFACVE